MSIETDYVAALLLGALKIECGSMEKAWEAVLKSHEDQLERAPEEIHDLLHLMLKTQIVDKFSNKPTMH